MPRASGASSNPRLYDPIFGVSAILDRPPEPVIGRRFAPTRWRTMTSLKAKTPKQNFGVYLYL
jgi:hypothetical protein